jgi:hypothetical protein
MACAWAACRCLPLSVSAWPCADAGLSRLGQDIDPVDHLVQDEEGLRPADAGQLVTRDFINSGHEWYVWRILLRDFLTWVAFFPVTR